jgi:3D (Asp-Asp-Asp) domain-containing protein
MVATGYAAGRLGGSLGTRTATGLRAQKGVVAVDPRVISMGSRLYIPNYGFAIAADKGSAIKGNRIDLCFDNYREARRFGRRSIDVYVLR